MSRALARQAARCIAKHREASPLRQHVLRSCARPFHGRTYCGFFGKKMHQRLYYAPTQPAGAPAETHTSDQGVETSSRDRHEGVYAYIYVCMYVRIQVPSPPKYPPPTQYTPNILTHTPKYPHTPCPETASQRSSHTRCVPHPPFRSKTVTDVSLHACTCVG